MGLFEHIRERLPDKYNLGDNNSIIVEGTPNHSVFQQSLREDHEGDVGIFETQTSDISMFAGVVGYETRLQFGVVTKDGDIDSAKAYLREALNNIKQNKKSDSCSVANCKLISIMPVGKNSVGLQMVTMNIIVKYILN